MPKRLLTLVLAAFALSLAACGDDAETTPAATDGRPAQSGPSRGERNAMAVADACGGADNVAEMIPLNSVASYDGTAGATYEVLVRCARVGERPGRVVTVAIEPQDQ